MVDIAAKKAEGKGRGYEKWATLHNLKQMAATMSVYEESGFSSPEELEAALAAANTELHETTGKLKAVESTLREKKDLQKQLLAYIKTKPARDGLRAQKTEKARRAYREQHESEFIIPNLPPGISRHRESPNCQLPRPYKRRLSSLPKRKTPLQRVPGEERERPGIADREKQS